MGIFRETMSIGRGGVKSREPTFLADIVEVLHDGADRVAVGSDDDLLAVDDLWADLVQPERNHARHRILQRLQRNIKHRSEPR